MDPDYNELKEEFSRSVLRIHILRLERDPKSLKEEWKPAMNLSGIVTVASNTFCHITVCSRKFFYDDTSQYRYQVIFVDGSSEDFDVNTVKEGPWLASFYVPTLGKKADAVQFNTQIAERHEKVWVFGYDCYSESLLDHGSITHTDTDEGHFDQDCPPNSYTSYGYPVFSFEKKLVGISYYDYGVTRALDVKQMTKSLSAMVEGMTDKPLHEILQRIEVIGEAKFKGLEESATL